MTIKNTDKTTICFDPLVQLNQSVIDKVPENIRVLEFFNKGLYESLINAHGNKKQITLEQAKKHKIIDNNIQITLNALFPTNGILYIKDEPYAIADVQWSKENWKIDRKNKDIPKIDVNKLSDPIAYNTLIKNEIMKSYDQLDNLPKDLIYGSNFDRTTEEISLMDKERKINTNKVEEARIKKETEEARIRETEEARIREIEEVRRIREIEEARRIREEARLKEEAILTVSKIKKPSILAIEDASTPLVIKPIQKPPLVIEEIKNIQMSEDNKPSLQRSPNSTKILRTYFSSDIFYSMINMIYRYMTDDEKFFIQNLFKNTTNIDVKGLNTNISKAAYLFTINGSKNISSGGVIVKKDFTDGLRVVFNQGGGDCFFLAIADAINHYNYYNDIGNKITYGMYGNGNNLFTAKNLRIIVSTEIIKLINSDSEFLNTSLDLGKLNLQILNDEFEDIMLSSVDIPQEMFLEYYNNTLADIYSSRDNFFVIIPEVVKNKNRPFKLISNDPELKQYIESEYYWADQKAIDLLVKILKLNILVIDNTADRFTVPFPTIKSDNNNTWNKYLFLYKTNNHYELITFDYLMTISSKVVKIKKTIFNRGNEIVPPFYIIFLLFSVFYIKLSPDDKAMVMLFLNFFKSIQKSFNSIMDEIMSSDRNIANFITNFENYFGPIKREILGGATNNMLSSKILKNNDDHDNIQISFHITIDMELQKGTTLSKEQISNIKCIKGWNKVRKSFANFTGKKYVIPPIYENLSDKYNKKEEKEEKDKNNTTKKNISGGDSKEKKRSKTIKYLK